jgi:hypothetical protein
MNDKFTGNGIYLTLFKKVGFKRFATSFSSNFGWFWLFVEPASFFIPGKLSFGLSGYLSLVFVSLALAILQNLPRIAVSSSLSSPDTEIEIKVGDLFHENGHLVIGSNDVFDTEPGEIIRDSSVQGQFLKQFYKGNLRQFDAESKLHFRLIIVVAV